MIGKTARFVFGGAMKTTAPNLWQTNLPKIGIRPTIDGRLGGVRESLEVQTHKQAQSVPWPANCLKLI